MPRPSALATRNARGQSKSATPSSSAESQITGKSKPSKGKLGVSKKTQEKAKAKVQKVQVPSQEVTKRRKKNGQAALIEIRKLQKTQNNLIPKSVMKSTMRSALEKYGPAYNMSPIALQMMQDAAEAFLIQYFQDALRIAIHAGRVTVMSKDLAMVKSLRHNETHR
eukprot:TRINITY_DN7928_c0_g1_i1.p1 TRINITY_DN7928_c0_g1~~TRINITY_DN7928_c0_g1_i1.p1  ORF type:complete len:181 (+),score=55.46 TRINITY_DN7928_c0_g1_i1:48-545(+)